MHTTPPANLPIVHASPTTDAKRETTLVTHPTNIFLPLALFPFPICDEGGLQTHWNKHKPQDYDIHDGYHSVKCNSCNTTLGARFTTRILQAATVLSQCISPGCIEMQE